MVVNVPAHTYEADVQTTRRRPILKIARTPWSRNTPKGESSPAARRRKMLEEAISRNPLVRPELCAFTPTEALITIRQSRAIQTWFANLWRKEESGNKLHIFFPADPTSGWGSNNGSTAYRNLEIAVQDCWFARTHLIHSLSAPLGVVPAWKRGAMPLADFSGLQRPFTRRAGTRWDYRAYRTCVRILGGQVAKFLRVNEIQSRERHVFVVRKGSLEAEIVKETQKAISGGLRVLTSDAVFESDAGRSFMQRSFMEF